LKNNTPDDDKLLPVLFEIIFIGEEGLFNMAGGFSAFANEDEILI